MSKLFSIYKTLFNNPTSNIPALFFMVLGFFGIIVIIISFITNFLTFPFMLVSTIASFFAMWYLNILGSLTKQVDKLESTVEMLKSSNDTLHNELLSLKSLYQFFKDFIQIFNLFYRSSFIY